MTATTIFTIPDGETFQSFAQLNNILIVITDVNRYLLLWDQDTETYLELEDAPNPSLYAGVKEWHSMTNSDESTNDFIDTYNLMLIEIEKYVNAGYIQGQSYVFCRFAYKLFDGSYINHSIPISLVSYREFPIVDQVVYRNDLRVRKNPDWYYELNYFAADFLYYFTQEQKNILILLMFINP